jgi:NTE family protein
VIDSVGSDADMVDSWRTIHCVATNFSRASELVITRGKMAKGLRASVSIPVALPPVLWQGELLLDGGVFNNFPVDVMAKMGARRIIGVDLGRARTRRYDFDELPGTWRLLWDRFRGRRRQRYKLPNLSAILMGTTILYSESRRDQAREATDIYLQPDLRGVGLMEWKALDRIVDAGHRHTREVLSKMSEEELALYRNT